MGKNASTIATGGSIRWEVNQKAMSSIFQIATGTESGSGPTLHRRRAEWRLDHYPDEDVDRGPEQFL